MSFGQRTPKRKALAASLVLLFACSSFAAPAENKEAVDVDNTKMNQRDAEGTTLTADDQARGSTQDVELTRKVRQELVNDKSLSTDARNVKIITLDGVVTLRGPVETSAEKAKLNSLTKKVSGVKKVDNQTEVKTKTY
jgi:hyperosmotically inducible protein